MSGSKSSAVSSSHTDDSNAVTGKDSLFSMTVHTPPDAVGGLVHAERTRFGRWKMFGVLLICAAPVIASYFTYYVVRPEGRRNYGELIDPQRSMPEVAVKTLDGQVSPVSALKGQWLLVSVAGAQCEEPCPTHLYLQRQLRESLGKEKDRIDWVWLVNDEAPVPQSLTAALEKAVVVRMDEKPLNLWLEPAKGHRMEEHLYVIDPRGHWMLRFPANMDSTGASKAKRDLERLLRASSSWDEAGRPPSGL